MSDTDQSRYTPAPRDDTRYRKRRRINSSTNSYSSSTSVSPTKRKSQGRNLYRHRSKNKLQHDNNKRSHRDPPSSNSLISSTNSSSSGSRLSSNGRRSRSRRRFRKKKRSRARNYSNSRDLMKDLINAINNRGSNTHGAQDVIPQFDPGQKSQSTRAWIRKVNEVASIYGWINKQTIYHALSKLSGLARRWYEGLDSIDLSWKDWQRKH
ncbi:unnamed protein product [Arctia plantaginis]|uniref:Uncharacterized protein n=1 Tax=Arctia plantaginis TaxID=874455 RepID=A0A8S1AZG4_ARCPL|nr:unnamed protein product [Arctia plantaginis]